MTCSNCGGDDHEFTTDFSIYHAAGDAETTLTRELRRAYPRQRPGDTRYRAYHTDPGVRAALVLFRAAMSHWSAEQDRVLSIQHGYAA